MTLNQPHAQIKPLLRPTTVDTGIAPGMNQNEPNANHAPVLHGSLLEPLTDAAFDAPKQPQTMLPKAETRVDHQPSLRALPHESVGEVSLHHRQLQQAPPRRSCKQCTRSCHEIGTAAIGPAPASRRKPWGTSRHQGALPTLGSMTSAAAWPGLRQHKPKRHLNSRPAGWQNTPLHLL